MPPRSRNHRVPAACDAPTTIAASSLVSPLPISRQNKRSTSRRSEGFPGDFIGALPVNSLIQPAGLPISTSTIEVLRRPVESAEYTGGLFTQACASAEVRQSMGRTGSALDNAVAESFNSTLEFELLSQEHFTTRGQARAAVAAFIDEYNTTRRHSSAGGLPPVDYELAAAHTHSSSPVRGPDQPEAA
jgi:transposase InsO family protein